jgi:alpha-L-fucosidase
MALHPPLRSLRHLVEHGYVWGYQAGRPAPSSEYGTDLLNVGPKPDGSFQAEERDLLSRIGDWLAVNGETIYGTRPFAVSGEGPTEVKDSFLSDADRANFTAADTRFTTRADIVYATSLDWPRERLLITSLAEGSPHLPGPIASVELIGQEKPLAFERRADGLSVMLPRPPSGSVLPVLRITPAVRIPNARKYELRN